ncbi:MAG: AAA family ATPase, partial [Planctomycetes bacterium]|nr:AAA family ATPase [Planctomycetota bacterium]
ALEVESEITGATDAIRTAEARIAEYRERIAGIETAIEHQRGRSRDLEEEVARHRRQLTALGVRAGDLEQQLQQTDEAVAAFDAQRQQVGQQLGDQERRLTDLTAQLDALRGQSEQHRNVHVEKMRLAARWGNEVSALAAQVDAAAATLARNQQRLAEIDVLRQTTQADLSQLGLREQELALNLEQRTQELEIARSRLAEQRRQQSRQVEELNDLRQRHSGAVERAAVLDELEQRLEGVDAGVKELLSRARQSPGGPWRAVRGLVAEMLQANVEMAPLIDAALGEIAQFLVVDAGPEFFSHLERESYSFQGRVGFLALHAAEWGDRRTAADKTQLDSRPGVLGRADRFVETSAEFASLAQRLLESTWIVERLAHAVELAQDAGPSASFVTLAGEVVRADGAVTAGPRQTAIGLVSRRSELRALRQQIQEFERRIAQSAAVVEETAGQVEEQEARLQSRAVEHQRALDAVAEQRERLALVRDRQVELDAQHHDLTAETAAVRSQHAAASEAQSRASAELKSAEAQVAEIEAALSELTANIAQLDNRRADHERQAMATRVELAKSEERLANLQAQLRQLQRDQQERQRVIEDSRAQLAECQRRIEQSSVDILAAESQVAELYLHKEGFAADAVAWVNRREELRSSKAQLAEQVQSLRAAARRLEEQLHQQELSANEVRHERKAMADRLRDDYGIEIGDLALPSAEPASREAVDQEIEDLRRKVHHMGSVNLDALEELDQLEARHGSLAAQYQDLSNAKGSLEQIINKINADSRRLFSDTLEVVRGHFQTLFRKLFGGGQADIVLEEGIDILDSGIEIVARPPGKEPRSISLLSGGEKTLTCVALLLSIFRSRPSPFCVLDEVDAALDEANIERFAAVLQEFLAWTQFIVVTHSKKTMTCANTLYGVTMQESGVSKRVSVRFDDISDTGEFRWAEPDGEGEPAEGDTQAA